MARRPRRRSQQRRRRRYRHRAGAAAGLEALERSGAADGRSLVSSIWGHEVITVRGRYYLAAGNWAMSGPVVSLNLSYFAPYAYRIFAQVDRDHNWEGLITAGYQALFDASSAPLGSAR